LLGSKAGSIPAIARLYIRTPKFHPRYQRAIFKFQYHTMPTTQNNTNGWINTWRTANAVGLRIGIWDLGFWDLGLGLGK
jgi:hypothetical protein